MFMSRQTPEIKLVGRPNRRLGRRGSTLELCLTPLPAQGKHRYYSPSSRHFFNFCSTARSYSLGVAAVQRFLSLPFSLLANRLPPPLSSLPTPAHHAAQTRLLGVPVQEHGEQHSLLLGRAVRLHEEQAGEREARCSRTDLGARGLRGRPKGTTSGPSGLYRRLYIAASAVSSSGSFSGLKKSPLAPTCRLGASKLTRTCSFPRPGLAGHHSGPFDYSPARQ